jgi:hypothetical protein
MVDTRAVRLWTVWTLQPDAVHSGRTAWTPRTPCQAAGCRVRESALPHGAVRPPPRLRSLQALYVPIESVPAHHPSRGTSPAR